MSKITGNTLGIKNSILANLEALYDFEIGREEFLPPDFAGELARISAEINKEISVYIARDGEILDISIGSDTQVSLKQMHLRRNLSRLSCIRCVHTHPNATAHLSELDLSALRQLLLDAMCALGVEADGSINSVSCAFLGERENGVPGIRMLPPIPFKKLDQDAMMAEIKYSDAAVLQGITEKQDERERTILLGIESEESLDELEALLESAGGLCVGRLLQKKQKPEKASFVGSGMLETLANKVQTLDAELVIADDELTSVQQHSISAATGVRVIDRTTLILDIFAKRATTGEGKLQVELAQLSYRQGHLVGLHEGLSRLAGGIGTRGPGESKLEIDRRRIRERMTLLRQRLKQLETQRSVRRKQREKNSVPVVTLVGYTNTGKSTLLKQITGADVFVKDALFATLDPTSRRVEREEGKQPFVLVDSVGFIRKLPTTLVEAFKSTLEEAKYADLLLIVSDGASEEAAKQRETVEEVLQSLGASTQPRIEVINKTDKAPQHFFLKDAVYISAKTGEGIETLLERINAVLTESKKTYSCIVPFHAFRAVQDFRKLGDVLSETYLDEGTRIIVMLDEEAKGKIEARHGLLLEETEP